MDVHVVVQGASRMHVRVPVQAVYTVLREAEHRSTAPIAYWEIPGAKQLVPRQRSCVQALQVRHAVLRSPRSAVKASIC